MYESFGVMSFVFLWRIFANIPTTFFSYFSGLQRRYLRRFLSHIRRNKIYPYKRRLWSIGYPFVLIFIIPYFVSSSICYYFTNSINISIVIGLILPIVLCSLYFPVYVKGCHIIVAELRQVSTSFLKEEVEKEIESIDRNPTLSEEEKELIKNKFKNLEDMLNKESKNKRDE